MRYAYNRTEGLAQMMMRTLCLIFLFILLQSATMPAFAAEERRYMTVWQKGTGANIITGPLSWSELLERGTKLTKQGLRLDDVETFMTPGGRRYIGVWDQGSGTNLIVNPLRENDFEKKRLEMKAKGLHLIDFEVFRDSGGQLLFLGVWRNGNGAEAMNGPLAFDAFVQAGKALIGNGLRLDDVEIVGSGPNRQYYGLWHSGAGSNLIVSPLRAQDFGKKVKELTKSGLKLIDLEVLRENLSPLYVSVWTEGPAANRITMPLSFKALLARGKMMVKQGYRLLDVEQVIVGRPDKPGKPRPPGGGSPPSGGIAFEHLPSYVRLTDQPRLIVDFSTAIDNPPRITIPADFLPLLPTDKDGSTIFPDNFCGLRVKQASRFVFLKDGKVADEFPFNNIPESSSLNTWKDMPQSDRDHFYLGGIDFTGPIGACKSNTGEWQFFYPFTKDNAGAPAEERVTLVIEMEGDSEIEFLNFQQVKGEALESYELYKEETKKKFEEAMKKLLLSFEIDSGYCGIDLFLEESCKDAKEDHKSSQCLIGADFESPC